MVYVEDEMLANAHRFIILVMSSVAVCLQYGSKTALTISFYYNRDLDDDIFDEYLCTLLRNLECK